jgi:glycosyltransferase involved in cell wall biosynthesis
MPDISICITIQNRAHLFKYLLESLTRQDIDPDKIEICISDGDSSDNLINLIDTYSEIFTFQYCRQELNRAPIPTLGNCPASVFNPLIRWVPTTPFVIKIDPEIVMLDPWLISEILRGLQQDDTRTYNARTHFTEGDQWYRNLDDIMTRYEQHYHYAEGGPFSRSKFYFCSGFSRDRFIELGGIEELFGWGVGYEDTCFREMWKNRFGNYEKEISAQALHLWHGPNHYRSTWESANKRLYERFRSLNQANTYVIKSGVLTEEAREWGVPETLSCIYTIRDGVITDIRCPHTKAMHLLDLPFGGQNG